MTDAQRKWLILGATTERQELLRSYQFVRNEERRAASWEALGPNAVNIFVGANNSGKSRFLRSLLTGYRQLVLAEDLAPYWKGLCGFVEWYAAGGRFSVERGEIAVGPMKALFEAAKAALLDPVDHDAIGKSTRIISQNVSAIQAELPRAGYRATTPETAFVCEWFRLVPEPNKLAPFQFAPNVDDAFVGSCAYLPLLRYTGRFQFHVQSEDDLLARVAVGNLQQRFDGKRSSVVTGLGLYKELLAMATGNREKRERLSDFETLLSRDPAMCALPRRNAAQYSQPLSACVAGAPGVSSAV